MAERRRFAIKPKSEANSGITITPLVDVVLVLLIIFMVVTPLRERDILVRVRRSGELTIDGRPVTMAELAGRVGSLLAGRGADGKIVFVSPDDDASYGHLVSVFDRVREGGAETLGMATAPPPPGE